jgi:hypothetical protein
MANDFAGFVAALKGGALYVNVHTSTNPNGEIRGQVTLTQETSTPTPTATETATASPPAPTVTGTAVPAAPRSGTGSAQPSEKRVAGLVAVVGAVVLLAALGAVALSRRPSRS